MMDKFDINNNKLGIGDVVVLFNCIEAKLWNFGFWKVISCNEFSSTTVFAECIATGMRMSFDCKCLKKVDKRYKELIDKATPMKPIEDFEEEECYHEGEYERIYFHLCPVCGEYVYKENNKNYCGNCGQKFDWSE